jgi:hypothetical protein
VSEQPNTARTRYQLLKKYLLVFSLSSAALVSLWVADHWIFPYDQVHRVNYLFVTRGMSQEKVKWLLGKNGWTCREAPRVADDDAPTGWRPIVGGDKVMVFSNLPSPTPFEAIYVGFTDDRVVDKCYHVKDSGQDFP